MPEDGSIKYELKIQTTLENGTKIYQSLMLALPNSEEMLIQAAHVSIHEVQQGSVIVLLHPETSETATKLRQFIENGDISRFLAQLFKNAGLEELFTNNEPTIEIQIKKVEFTGTCTTLANFLKCNYLERNTAFNKMLRGAKSAPLKYIYIYICTYVLILLNYYT